MNTWSTKWRTNDKNISEVSNSLKHKHVLFWSYHKHENAHQPNFTVKVNSLFIEYVYVIWWWRRTYWKIKADIRVTLKRFNNNMWFFGRQTTRVNLKRYVACMHTCTWAEYRNTFSWNKWPLAWLVEPLMGDKTSPIFRFINHCTAFHVQEKKAWHVQQIIKSIPFILILFNRTIRTRYLSHSLFSDLVNL